jgi:hypothetical protein
MTLGALFDELDLDNRRCIKLCAFEAELPYKEENCILFKDILSADKFLPHGERGKS